LATLFLGDINTETWTFRLRESLELGQYNMVLSSSRDSDHSGTVVARISSNSKLQTSPLVREGVLK
jgi:hypothetical protein